MKKNVLVKKRSGFIFHCSFLPFDTIGYHWSVSRKLRHESAIYPKILIYIAHVTIALLVRHSHEKDPFWCETQDFSEIKKTREENYKGMLCAERVTRGSQTCHISRTLLCSPIGRIARNFSLYILPSEYLLSISLYHSHYLDTSAKMIHRVVKMTHESFIALDPLYRSKNRDATVSPDNTIFKHTISLSEYDFSFRISYLYVIVFFFFK